MAREDIRETLAKQSPAKTGALLGLVLVVLGALYWQFFYSSLRDDVNEATSRNQSLESRNQSLLDRADKYDDLLDQRDELEENLRASLVSLPLAAELSAFFVHLQRQAAASGVHLHQWSRRDEEEAGDYMKVPVQIEVRGTFYEIMEYFYLIYETERVITIEDFTLTVQDVDEDDELELAAEFTAATFRQRGDGLLAELDAASGVSDDRDGGDGGADPAEDEARAPEGDLEVEETFEPEDLSSDVAGDGEGGE